MSQIKQNLNLGDIVKIPLGSGQLAFARILKNLLMAFYGLKSEKIPPIEFIISQPIIFKIWVMKHDWPVIGNSPLTSDLEKPPIFSKCDPISKKLSLYYMEDGKEKSASFEECENLECAAVWSPSHIIDRLNDYFAGKPNKWVESMKPRS
ncbi:MAG: Imm26 family immunity protein [Verrucomicrobiota bacterium]